MANRQEITYESPSTGEAVVLTGKDTGAGGPALSTGVKHWVDREHPDRKAYRAAEAKMSASYHATRDMLARYLVPHRFEGALGVKPETLRRSRLGYGISLNAAYLAEIMGHVRGAVAEYVWGPLAEGVEPDEKITERPTGGVAMRVWDDATRGKKTWPEFFGVDVLEKLLSTPGGFLVVDNVALPVTSKAEEAAAGKRPYVRYFPWSAVEDYGWGEFGLRWIKFAETSDERKPMETKQEALSKFHLLYELRDGATVISRWNEKGERVDDEVNMGTLVDPEGRPTLPIVHAVYGEHPEIDKVGTGLLLGLDDIVIDLFNVVSEAREGYRDAAFAMNTYRGSGAENVRNSLADGSRFVALGDESHADFQRIAGDGTEVSSGIELLRLGLEAWKLSAKRRAEAEAETSAARSGISLNAEFQLDLVPLLVRVSETIDTIETNVMYLVAQVANVNLTPEQIEDVGVERSREFQPEDEASRIGRIVTEFVEMLDLVPAEAKAPIVVKWIDASKLVDMDEEVELEGGGKSTLRKVIEAQVLELARQKEDMSRQAAEALAAGPQNAQDGEGGQEPPPGGGGPPRTPQGPQGPGQESQGGGEAAA